jgi:hypothetical protein
VNCRAFVQTDTEDNDIGDVVTHYC